MWILEVIDNNNAIPHEIMNELEREWISYCRGFYPVLTANPLLSEWFGAAD